MKRFTYSGSTTPRTIACPSWVKLAAALPKVPEAPSSFAIEGTMLHLKIYDYLNGDIDNFEDDSTLSADQVARLNDAVSAWDEFCIQEQIEDYALEVEMSMNDDIGGTSDVIAWNADTRFIVDWKFGLGVAVAAEDNLQLLFYAMMDEFVNPTSSNLNLVVAIVQPMPSRGGHQTLQTWAVPNDTFQLFKKTFMQAVNSEGLHAGPHCRYCPVAPTCPEKTGEARAALLASPEDMLLLAENLDRALNLETWIADVKSFAHQQLELGAEIDGFKLVAKRATRKWLDGAEESLRKYRKLKVVEVMETKLLSPTQIEKVFKAKKLDFARMSAYIKKSSSGTTLARADDPRDGTMSISSLKSALGRIS